MAICSCLSHLFACNSQSIISQINIKLKLLQAAVRWVLSNINLELAILFQIFFPFGKRQGKDHPFKLMHYLAKSRKSRCLFNMTLMSLRISLLGFSNQHLLSYQRMHWFCHSYTPSSVFMGICNLRTWCFETYDLFAIVVEMFSGLEGLHWASSTVQVIKHIKLFHISSCRIVCFETDRNTWSLLKCYAFSSQIHSIWWRASLDPSKYLFESRTHLQCSCDDASFNTSLLDNSRKAGDSCWDISERLWHKHWPFAIWYYILYCHSPYIHSLVSNIFQTLFLTA